MDERLIETVKQWNMDASLPLQVGDFTLRKDFSEASLQDDDYAVIFAYVNERKGWTVEGVYHNGSGDFSVRTDIGMLEFTLIEFITDDFATFTKMVETRLPHIIETHYVHCREDFSVILTNKGVPTVTGRIFCLLSTPALNGSSSRLRPCGLLTALTW